MSERERRNFDDSFKAKIALEAVREEKTISELAGIYKVHANLIRKWKREFEAGASKVFFASKDENKELKQLRSENEHLEQLIGKQRIMINWFKKSREIQSPVEKRAMIEKNDDLSIKRAMPFD